MIKFLVQSLTFVVEAGFRPVKSLIDDSMRELNDRFFIYFFVKRAFFVILQLRWPSGKSVRLGSCRPGFDSESGQPMTLKLVFTASCLTLSIKGTVWSTSRQVYLCLWERHLAGLPHFGVVDKWLATPQRAR